MPTAEMGVTVEVPQVEEEQLREATAQEVQSAKYSAERLTFGTMDAFQRPVNNRKISAPSRTFSPRKSAIPRAPVPGSPRTGYPPQYPGSGPYFAPVPPPMEYLESPRRMYSPRGRRYSPHRHSTSFMYPSVEVSEPPEQFEVQKGEHQRNHSAPVVGHNRTGSGSSVGGKEICRYFLRTGTCGYGNKCRYDHPKSAHKPNLNTQGYPIREGECICRFFVKNGWCGFGATCKFHHPELPQRPPQIPPMPSSPYHAPAYSPVPPMYPMPPHPGMYHQGMMPATTCMPQAMPPMSPNMYPYMFMNGMVPPMVPPAPWAVPPPMPPHMQDIPCNEKKGDGIQESLSGTGSNVSTSSVVSNGHGEDVDIERQASLSSSTAPPESQ